MAVRPKREPLSSEQQQIELILLLFAFALLLEIYIFWFVKHVNYIAELCDKSQRMIRFMRNEFSCILSIQIWNGLCALRLQPGHTHGWGWSLSEWNYRFVSYARAHDFRLIHGAAAGVALISLHETVRIRLFHFLYAVPTWTDKLLPIHSLSHSHVWISNLGSSPSSGPIQNGMIYDYDHDELHDWELRNL